MSYAKYHFFAIRLEMLFHLSVTVFTRKGQQDTVQKGDIFISLLSQLILHKEYTFHVVASLGNISSLPIFIGYSSRIPNVDKSLDKRKHLFYDFGKLFKVSMYKLRQKVHITKYNTAIYIYIYILRFRICVIILCLSYIYVNLHFQEFNRQFPMVIMLLLGSSQTLANKQKLK